MRAFGQYVLIKKLPRRGESDGGILLPDLGRDQFAEAEIISVGFIAEKWKEDSEKIVLEDGMKVLILTTGIVEARKDGEKFYFIKPDHIFAIMS